MQRYLPDSTLNDVELGSQGPRAEEILNRQQSPTPDASLCPLKSPTGDFRDPIPDKLHMSGNEAKPGGAMAGLRILAPRKSESPLADWLASCRFSNTHPFAASRIQLLGAFSQRILKDPILRDEPSSVALAYYLRPANITKIATHAQARAKLDPSVLWVPCGGVFHVAPANVETFFIYPWALSYLCGNNNLVRLSLEEQPVTMRLLECLNTLMETEEELSHTNRFVTYPHDPEITRLFSDWCAHRIIWGGDEVIRVLRSIPLSPHATERVFGSKFSYAVISAMSFQEADEATRQQVISRFFNDMFWFNQMACSSPHVVFWVGTKADGARAVAAFNPLLGAEVLRRGYALPPQLSVRRLSQAFELAIQDDVRVDLKHPGFASIDVPQLSVLRKEPYGGGLLHHVQIDRLDRLLEVAAPKDQTIVHFGFHPDELQSLAFRIGSRGVDRLVPIGEALTFEVVWDGQDMISDGLRKVVIRC